MCGYKFLLIFGFLRGEKIGSGKRGFCWDFCVFDVFRDGKSWWSCGALCGKGGELTDTFWGIDCGTGFRVLFLMGC
jgi:hypothetical protein